MKITLEYKGNDEWHVSDGEQNAIYFTLPAALDQVRRWAEYNEAVLDDRVSNMVSRFEQEGNEIAEQAERLQEERHASDLADLERLGE